VRAKRRAVGRPPGRAVAALVSAAAAVLVMCSLAGCGAAGLVGGSVLPPPSSAPSATRSTAQRPPKQPPTATTPKSRPVRSPEVASLAPGVADEASGIAAATGRRDAFFVVDDGTGTSQIVAIDSKGATIARIDIDGMSAYNAEALSAGSCGSTPTGAGEILPSRTRCLYIGDIGGNSGRENIVIYRIVEPSLSPVPANPVPADAWSYDYPDEPQNAEGLLVEPDGSLLVITKPSHHSGPVGPHRIYRAPPGGGQLRLVSRFSPPDPPIALQSLLTGNVVTDAAAAPGRVLLLTYDQVVEYLAPSKTADLATFPDWPHRNLTMPPMVQAEGITPTTGGCGYAVASEAGPGGDAGAIAVVPCG
jgi:hypothetical protein